MQLTRVNEQAEDPLPFSFHLNLPKSALPVVEGADLAVVEDVPRIAIHKSIHQDLLLKHSSLVSTEDVFIIECEPEAVFKVREITRCSSSIDGELTVPSKPRVELTRNWDWAGHASPILCASFSPTGKMLATGSGDNTCRLWDLDTETPKYTLSGHTNWVLCVEWDGMERNVATGSMDNTVSESDVGIETGADWR
jgi:ribosome assembly protein 4